MTVTDAVANESRARAYDRVAGEGIDIEGLTKVYRLPDGDSVPALESVDLSITSGQFVCLLGPSGCGKSTLLHTIAGLLAPTNGSVRIGQTKVNRPYTNLGLVFQTDLLLEWRTALENVLLQIEMRGLRKRDFEARARDLLALMGIDDFADKYPRHLSGGMRQRVAIARALVHDPALLLMDEPFAQVDALTRDRLNADLASLSSRSMKTTVFVTHSIPEAVFLADRVVVFSRRPGRVVADTDINLPHPRTSEMRDSLAFVEYARSLRDVLERTGAFIA